MVAVQCYVVDPVASNKTKAKLQAQHGGFQHNKMPHE